MCFSAGLFAMAFCAMGSLGSAQTASTQSEEEVEDLSPFVVTTSVDTGYAAEETLAGTRLRTPVRDTPVALSVLTAKLLDDLGATDFRDVLDFVPSTDVYYTDAADPVGNGAAGKDPTTMVVRGFRTNMQTRNFFTSSIAADRYIAQEFTFARGPNALLFGIGNPGGGVHIQTNRAHFNDNGGSISALYDTEGSYRTSLDKNFRLIKDRLAARVDLLWEESQTFQTPSERNKRAAYLTVTGHPFNNNKRTTIVANYERGRRDDVKARPFAPYDNFSTWVANGAPLYDNFVDARPGTVFSSTTPFMRNESFFVNVLSQDYVTPYRTTINQSINGRPYRSFVRSLGPIVNGQAVDTNSMMTDFVSLNPLDLLLKKFGGDQARLSSWLAALGPARAIPEAFANGPLVIPMDTFVSGDGERIVQDWNSTTLLLEQRVGDNFDIQVAGYVEDFKSSDLNVLRGSDYGIQYDPNLYLPNGAPNPYAGVPYVQNSLFALHNLNDALSYEQRMTTQYKLDLNDHKVAGFGLGRYMFSTLFNFYRNSVEFAQRRPHVTSIAGVPTSPNVQVAANRLHDRYYFVPGQPLYVHDPLLPLGAGAAYEADWIDAVATRTRTAVDSYAASLQGYLFNDRVVVLGGIRRDMVKTWSTVQQTYTPATASGTNYPGEVDLAATYKAIAPQTDTTVDNTSLGVVYHVTKPFSLFYNRATNANPRQVQRDVFYNVVPVQRGEGTDYGVKFKLFDGKLQGSYTRYQTTQTNNTGTGIVGPANFDDNIDLILQLVDPAEYARRSSFGVAWVAAYDTVTEGDEIEFVFAPTRNLTFRVAASRQETKTARKYDDLLEYLSLNLPAWKNYGNNSSNPQASRDAVNTAIQAIEADLPIYRSVNGAPQVGHSGYSTSASASYTFPRDSYLKGVSIGTNISYRGPVVLGYQVDANGTVNLNNQLKSAGPRYVNVHVGYRRKVNRHLDWSIRAQLSNVLDDTDPILRNAIWDYNTRAFVITQNSLTAPPKVTLTSTLRF
ncbi:MAG: hypothetical protein K1X42_08520 [Opitutaceae bacterium]|nr:hypothetical protein [Opitutaceae bacterium]